MTYKSNFEPYVSRSRSGSREGPFYNANDSLDSIRSLYPSLSSPKQPSATNYFIGYNHHYWAEAYSTQPLEEESSRRSLRRVNDCRLVSKVRKLLTRE